MKTKNNITDKKHVTGHFTGRLDASTVQEVEKSLDEMVTDECIELIFDLSDLDYCSSTGLRLFLTWAKRMKDRNGRFIIVNPNEVVMEIFEVTGFNDIIKIKKIEN